MNPNRIHNSILDSDLYKFTMGCIVQQFPNVKVKYRYINRDPSFKHIAGFEQALKEQVNMMEDIRLTDEEYNWMKKELSWLPLPYLQWLRQFRYDPSQVKISMNDGKLDLEIEGPLFEAIYWEVPLLYTISRLRYSILFNGEYFAPSKNYEDILVKKYEQMSASKVYWIDFGARRRFSYEVEDKVVEHGKTFSPFFRGTSNVHLAMKHGVKVFGTYAHEYVQLMQAMYGARMCNKMAMEHWSQFYRGLLGTALTDTVTTDVFLRDFDSYYAKLFDGIRQDSGDPSVCAEKIIAHYEKLKIDPSSKVIVFSDSLNPGKACFLTNKFSDRIRVTCGIGTNLSHDVGYAAMNHVIKAMAFDCGHGYVPVVKLSDDAGKHTGKPEDIKRTMEELQIS